MAFRFTGFADEAGRTLSEQIQATRRAGWKSLEARLLEGVNVCSISDAQFDAALSTLQSHGIQIAGFGSQIANWARPITTDFQVDIDELNRTIPRMKKSGAAIIRCMSYPNKDMERGEYKREVFRRLRHLAKIAGDAGVILGHENCNGFGGEGPAQTLELIAAVDHPAFKLIFDTGNNSLHDNTTDSTWNFYNAVKEHAVHIHIKAAKPGPDGKFVTCYPDEDPVQLRILRDLRQRNYDGWISIEPHIAAAVHAAKDVENPAQAADIYVDYAKRLEALVRQA
jgi:sugar phosphate isomerase/epimerase